MGRTAHPAGDSLSVFRPLRGPFGVGAAVFARGPGRPRGGVGCTGRQRGGARDPIGALTRLSGPSGPYRAYAVTFAGDDPAQLDRVPRVPASLEGDVVVAGECNIAAGTSRVSRTPRAAPAPRLGGAQPTFALLGRFAGVCPMRIDPVPSTQPGITGPVPGASLDPGPLVATAQ